MGAVSAAPDSKQKYLNKIRERSLERLMKRKSPVKAENKASNSEHEEGKNIRIVIKDSTSKMSYDSPRTHKITSPGSGTKKVIVIKKVQMPSRRNPKASTLELLSKVR